MENKLAEKIERLEAQLPRWEKWLYACYGASFTLLAHAFIKYYENTILSEALFFIEEKAGLVWSSESLPMFDQYTYDLSLVYISPGRLVFWLVIQIVTLAGAAILAFHPTWRKTTLSKRLGLIFGYLLAGWITLLSLGAHDPLNADGGYTALVIIYLIALGLGYWWLRRKKEKAEEIFL